LFSITICVDEYARLAKLNWAEVCSNTLTIGIGIPCAHRIRKILEDWDALAAEDFHFQWNLINNPETTVGVLIFFTFVYSNLIQSIDLLFPFITSTKEKK
jgi:hypothetical protein